MLTFETRFPDVPVTVTLAAPNAALALAVKVNVLPVVELVGLNDAVTPLGRPETLRLTVPLNPLAGTMAMLVAAVAPWTTYNAGGLACRLKFAGAVTCRVSAVLSVRVPETPRTVSG